MHEVTALDLDSIAEHARAGDQTALAELLAAIQPRVLGLCSRMLPCRQDAEEACQDALLNVATKLQTFDGRSRVTTWVYAVAANSARQTYRSLRRRAAESSVGALPPAVDPRTTSVIAGSTIDLLEALDRLEAEHPDWVAPLVLRDIAEREYADIAATLRIPLGTLKSRIHQARLFVRPLLAIGG